MTMWLFLWSVYGLDFIWYSLAVAVYMITGSMKFLGVRLVYDSYANAVPLDFGQESVYVYETWADV